MTADEKTRLFESFLSNGMDIKKFQFATDTDKQYFFGMYEEYLTAMSDDHVEIIYDKYNDITVLKRDKEVCSFYITDSNSTLRGFTNLSIEDEDLTMCLTMMFLTVKELNSMVDVLMKAFDNSKLSEKYKSTDSNKKFIPSSTLPKDIKNTINKIEQLQKSILKENKKYIIRTTKKDDE